MTESLSFSRRTLLAGSGGLVFSFLLPARGKAQQAMLVETRNTAFAPNAYLRIAQNGPITFILPNVEMGQGIYTGAVALIAEELEVSVDQIQIEAAPPDNAYIVKELGTQATGGSTSIMVDWVPLREAGAMARMMLVQAAANRWGVSASTCHVENGVVYNSQKSKSYLYADLAQEAASLPYPKQVALKQTDSFSLIGKPLHRIDSPIKVRGQAVYGIDIKIPGMKIGTVMASPVIGGKPARMDTQSAKAVSGVEDVLVIDDAVCVVANTYWSAKKGLEALRIVWDNGNNADLSNQTAFKQLFDDVKKKGIVASSYGEAEKAVAESHTKHEAFYQQPLLAHAPMEPINCTVHVHKEGCDIWVGSQVPLRARDSAAEITGLPKEKVFFHNQYIGGGFGRRLEHEYVSQSVKFAKQVSYPLKIIWSREEDIHRDRFRPPYVDHLQAGLDENGNITGIVQKLAGPSVAARWIPQGMLENGMDPDLLMASTHMPYTLPAMHYEYIRSDIAGTIPAWWRGVGGTRGLFVIEGFIDELAELAKKDPIEFRRSLVGKDERAKAVLDKVAEHSGWFTSSLPQGHGRGVALQYLFGSYLATVIEVAMVGSEPLRVIKATAVIDCGHVVNPDQVKAQIEGGLIFGISTALFNEITLREGRVEQSNFTNYRMLRINESPEIEVHIIPSIHDPGGVGETGTAAAAPALANAMAAASKKRYRRIPLLGEQSYTV